jgi:hypothetical protein
VLVLLVEQVAHVVEAPQSVNHSGAVRNRGGIFAVRSLLDASPDVCALAFSDTIRGLVEPILDAQFLRVRGLLFDKISGANWKVPWHQDVTIAGQERVEADGFEPWFIKADVLHVELQRRSWRT